MLVWKIFLHFLMLIYFCFAEDFLSKFTQNDYKLKDIFVKIDNFDKNVMIYFNAITFKPNRTIVAVNGSFAYKIDVEDKQEILVQAFKFMSNEYRIFPVRFQVSLARSYKANVVGLQNAKKCGFLNDTYFVKNVNYTVCNFVVEETKLPPLIPTGLYKIEVTFSYLNKNFAQASATGEIYRPIYPPKEKKQFKHSG